MFRLPPETAHELALHALAWGPARLFAAQATAPALQVSRFGLDFANPIGLAAGFDKNAVAVNSLAALGFGFLEVGTVTRLPQPGNPRPRLFRLAEERALINRLGFNNQGAAALARRLRALPARPACVIGVNIGKSRAVALEAAIPDYLASFAAVSEVADYVAVNISSPNTPNLRELQRPQALQELLSALQAANREAKPLLVKIAPDLDDEQLAALTEVALASNVAGLIATNTTLSRASLRAPGAEAGGLSGAPLFAPATQLLAKLYLLTKGRLPLIGVGGIFSAADAWAKICAGASLLQVYTGFIYQGPGFIRELHTGLDKLLAASGFATLDEAVGCRATAFASRQIAL
jgi:dihydroorotate dehydrogenase